MCAILSRFTAVLPPFVYSLSLVVEAMWMKDYVWGSNEWLRGRFTAWSNRNLKCPILSRRDLQKSLQEPTFRSCQPSERAPLYHNC
ncbi:hypothetical protein F5H01DRAFT_330550 [Linnemannia elongata]|nr:hypothetical protein F5H01DRAFT_330550 [Linnemannia elongata]